jgi:hypothetical protein
MGCGGTDGMFGVLVAEISFQGRIAGVTHLSAGILREPPERLKLAVAYQGGAEPGRQNWRARLGW